MSVKAPSEQSVGYLLKRAQQAFRAQMDRALEDHRLTTPQYAVLAALENDPGMSSADLARRSFVTPQTMIRIVAGLTERGLITRKEHPTHGRIRPAALTPEGLRTVQACHTSVLEVERRMIAPFSRNERRALTRLLQECAGALSERS
jgi:DNA-binding MarR family transcriptional regulator